MPRKIKLAEGQVPLFDDLPSHEGDIKVLRSLKVRERTAIVPENFTFVTETSQLRECATACREAGVFAFDTETTGLHWYAPDFKVVATGIYAQDRAYIIPHYMAYSDVNFDRGVMQDELGDVFTDPSIRKLVANAKFDMHAIRRTFGIEVAGIHHDAVLAGWLLDENLIDHGIETMLSLYFDWPDYKIKQDGKFGLWPLKMASIYLGKDAEGTFILSQWQEECLREQPKLHRLMYEVEMPHMLLLYEAERHGIAWDWDYCRNVMQPTINDACEKALEKVRDYLGPINPASTPQLAAALFDGLKLPDLSERSTDKRALSKISDEHPVIPAIQTWRKYDTIKKLFINKLPGFVEQNRIYYSIKPIGTVTGRQSASQPNLQQLPKQSIGPIIRRAFVPSAGNVLVTFDYSQIELRILAHLSGDPKMRAAFESGADFHSLTAHDMFGISMAALDADKDLPPRITAKNINFGIPYGIGANKLMDMVNGRLQELGADGGYLTEVSSMKAIRSYFKAYPYNETWIDGMKRLAKKQGYVETILGRKRRLHSPINNPDRKVSSMAERQAVNSPIQGSSADMIKVAAIKMDRKIKSEHWPLQFLLSIHDELVYEVPLTWLSHNRDKLDVLSDIMAAAVPLSVPIKVSVDVLKRWGDKITDDDWEADEST
jgi:DNA polymerase-1